jgi:hypothetical protein
MLDYRAHKLYWLLALPFTFASLLLSYGLIAASVLLSISYFENPFAQLAIAVVGMEASLLVLQIVFALLMWGFRAIFLFFIEVIPTEGRNKHEAAEVLTGGQAVRLFYKLRILPSEFDDDDFDELLKLMRRSQGLLVRTLRAFVGTDPRSLFQSTMEQRVREIVRVAKEGSRKSDTKAISGQLNIDEILGAAGLMASRGERLLVNYRHVIYKYVALLLVFGGYYILLEN